ncbi:RNA polymerase sigma factor [Paracnuella aquatica]|uniref:RNA polymerase sigma factor n=1 Tax=Paracnuella aquatica TaxID=2268757 RepID=UPI0019D4D721|nr:RNA polymerase sigma factor [Paracnuella aquatica]
MITGVDKKELFVAAIEVNKAAIYKIATVYTNGAEDRDDLVQEILYQLWKSFDTFQQKSSIGTWIYRVAMNVAIYQLKAASKRVATVELIDATAQHGDAPQGGE